MICVLDCETIPDTELVRAHFGLEGEDEAVTQEAIAQYEVATGSSFLPHPFHKIVAISAVFANEAENYGDFHKVGTFPGNSEEEILGEFLNYLNKSNPKLVTFNGRSFDLPLIFMRALRYNLTCPAYFETENKNSRFSEKNGKSKSKWENYRSRYSERFHLDLMDVIGNFGAVRGLKLDTLCQMAGLPGKYDVSGDQVTELFYRGQLQKIQEYCESDVLNTYLLFLKYELLQGNIDQERYKEILKNMQPKLPVDKSYTPVFSQFIQKEIDGRH